MCGYVWLTVGMGTQRKPLLRAERLQAIQALVEAGGGARVVDLAEEFGVSTETIRRDLERLEQDGHVVRDHGGVTRSSLRVQDRSYAERARTQFGAKREIARLAAAVITEGMVIAVDSSTTSLALATVLAGRDITVVTNGLPLAEQLATGSPTRVVLTGGELNPRNMSMTGPHALPVAGRYMPDVAFVSTAAIGDYGASDVDSYEVAVKCALVAGAKRVVVLADHTKIGKAGTQQVLAWEAISAVITDRLPDESFVSLCATKNVELIYSD